MWPDEYLRSRQISRPKFAEWLGCSESSFQLYMQRKRIPSLITALKIVELTDGKVSYKDLVDFYLSRPDKKEKRKYTRKNAAI
jgi:hypothetical protein